ncbi:unnamed protein product, partial [Discosporangium mesarthrocarpum]
DINLFHCAFGHAHEDALRKTAKRLAEAGVNITLVGKLTPCTGCALGKSLRRPIPKLTHARAGERLARVFVNLSGKKTKSLGGAHYLMIVRDYYSRYSWVYPLKKSDACEGFKAFLSEFHQAQITCVVMTERSDDSGEFLGGSFGALCRDFRVRQEHTCADTPQLNGVAER